MKLSEVRYLSVKHVLAMHVESMAVGGGQDGVRDSGLLESAVLAPLNAYVGSLAELAAMYAHGIAMDHAFLDGNKRTAVYAMLVFLELNGFELILPIGTWQTLIEDLAEGSVSRDQLAEEIAIELGRRNGRSGPAMWVDFEDDG